MAERHPRPNIVFILTDDQRFDAFGAAGCPVQTPAIDSLVRRGTWFTHAHVAGGTVDAICMPSRAMIHTGRSLFQLEDSGSTIPAEHTLLGEVLGGAGYTAFGSGKWHNGRSAFGRSFNDGDEIFFGGMADHWNVPAYHYDPEGRYDARLPCITSPMQTNELEYREADHVHAGRHSSEVIAEAAVSFLERHPQDDTPYFLYTAFLAPHDPRTMPEEFRTQYPAESVNLPVSFTGGHPFDNGALHVRDEELAGFPREPEEIRGHIAEYYAMIAHLDSCIGRIIKAVEDRGDLGRTLFVLAGDNGLAVGQHGLMGKQSLYDHSSRVPLVFMGPGVPSGQRREELVYLHDIAGTLLGLLGMARPESMTDTRDLLASADRSTVHAESTRPELYLAYESVQRGITTGRHKLIEYAVGGRHRVQLFELQNDPVELVDLAADPALATVRDDLQERLLLHARGCGDLDSPWGKQFWSIARPDSDT